MPGNRSYGDPCGVARGLDVVGERWSLLVVRELLLGPKRFNDLLHALSGVSPNVLSQRLHELVDHGVARRRDLGAPARVRLYELTEWGRQLEPVLLHLGRWGAAAPGPAAGRLSLDSLMLSVKAGFDPAHRSAGPATYAVNVGDDTFTLHVADGAVEVRRGTAARPDATVTTDHDTLQAACTGQRPWSEALASGDLQVRGDRRSQRELARLLTAPWSAR